MSVRIIEGDARAVLRSLPDESVDCCITSPPYYGLRSYGGGEAEIGREGTVQGFILNLVDVFGEVRRVLRPRGTCFVNIGDCYAGPKKGQMADGSVVGGEKQRTNRGTMENRATRRADFGGISGKQASNPASLHAGNAICPPGLKPKDLMLVPARLAIALQDDGWWVRSEIIWAKPNPMPESVKGRPSTAHEHIWMLTKSGQHFYDNDAAQEPVSDATTGRTFGNGNGRNDAGREYRPKVAGVNGYQRRGREHRDGPSKQDGAGNPTYTGFNKRWRESGLHKGHDSNTGFYARWAGREAPSTRRLRNYEDAPLEVWRFSPAQYRDAHFATFPPTLVERCLAAGCPAGGVVLDPFGGAGTTGLVADRLGYDAILAELNPEYAALAVNRIRDASPLTADVRAEPVQEALL